MKGLRNVLIFLSGAGVGAVGTLLYLKEKYLARADREIDEMRLHYEGKLEELKEMERDIGLTKDIISENGYDNPQNSIENDEKPVLAEEIVVKKPKKRVKKTVKEEKFDIPEPRIISFDEYTDDSSYGKCVLSYFEDDETVIDQNEEVVTDAINILGRDNLDQFGMIEEFEDDTLYIRNEMLGFDYEVVRERGSYEDFMKNCGN